MTRWTLPSRGIHDTMDLIDEEFDHTVIIMRAGPNKSIRVFCNLLRCPFEEICTDQEQADRAATEHKSMSEY